MSDTGRLIYHSNYDKTPIQAQAAERIDLKGTVNMCRADDGFLTACEGWQNLIKVKQIVPYTFCIPQHLWDHIKRRQPFEYDMALRFGLEFDLRQIERDTPGFIYTEYFHTMMYLKFATYIVSVSKEKALIAATELLQDTFKIRVAAHYKNKEDIIQLTPAGYGMFSKAEYVGKAGQVLKNGGPFMISARLYTMIFGKRWNTQAYNFAVSEGYKTPRKEEFEKIDGTYY